ncbi:hypothetical protein VC83_07761 [Pseudogymnoascus destructans]|uniref:GAR domain-containing protein n=2 Tax=Pseudogymnoascus destructans TaxID=655981 RepID=L8FPG4_PSED2|nr:uncharacterized protein VC83_07761 [Pseudogymnoascus destructans]ELR02368.1 hypothetical protein GMDG_05432 [Pseudogymnoascus destructans 20631-21]OAF55774.1 hypothetical protein VC83_07761 [Pseudogymnoascus destructans]
MMAKHKRDMSAFSIRDAPPALRFSPTSLRMRPRSPSKSPCRHTRSPTRSRITDDIFEDLSPARILERFTSASGELAKSIEASTPDQKQFGIRAAVASKKIEEWANEVGGWPWPSIGADGFVMPEKTYGIFGDLKEDDMGLEEEADTKEYWGSHPAPLVELYSNRVSEIFDDMFDLDIEEIKNKVLDLVATDAQPSATTGEHSLPTTPVKSKYTRLDTFTGMITHTVLDALPKLHRLRLLLDVWSIRIDILRDIPSTLESLRDADTMLQSAWASLKATNPSGEEMMLTRPDYETMQVALGETISDTGKMIDSMLDRLDGRVDTVPGPWLDQMDAVETDYGNWTIAAERKAQEGEWAIKAAKKAELEKSVQMLQELAEQQAAMADVGTEDEVAIEEEWEKVQIEHVAMSDRGSIPDTTVENIPISDDQVQELPIGSLDISDNGSDFGRPLAVGSPITNEAPQSDVPSTLQASTELQESRAFNIPWGFDGQDDRSPTAGRGTHKRGDESPSPPSTRNDAGGFWTPSRASLEPSEGSFRLGRSRTPSVMGRNTPPRLPLPYRIHTEGSRSGSPETIPSMAASPSPTGNLNLRPFILGTSAVVSSQPPSPIIPRGRSSRNSVAPSGWDIGDSQNAGSGNPISRRDSQTSPTSPIFPSFRGSPLFPGSRSSSISLRSSRSKKRSQTVFSDDEELALLAAASDHAAQMLSTPPARRGHTANEPKSSPRPDISTSDPFTDVPWLVPTPTTQAAAPLTPPPMAASESMHAIMSPSNQPGPTRQFSDDDCPPSPSKRIVLDDGGTPRSPKKGRKSPKERRLPLLSMSDDDDENPRSSANKPALQPGWPGLQEGAPKFELRSPWARNKNSESMSSTRRNSTASLGEKDPQKRYGMPSTPLEKASEFSGQPNVADTSPEPQPTHHTAKVVIDDVFVTQEQDHREISAVPHTTETEHPTSNTTHGSGASASFKAIITPVEEACHDWSRFSDPEKPTKVSPLTSVSNDKETPPLMGYQVDGGRSYGLDNSRHGSVVSFRSNDTVFKAHSRADSAGKLPVLNSIIAFESPRIVEDLVSDDGYDLDFSPSTRRSILYSNDIRQSFEEGYSEPSTPIFSVPPTLDFFGTEDTELDASVAEPLVSVDKLALEAPSFTNVDIDLQYSQASPTKISDDQLQQQISEILESIPAKIELSNAPISPQKSPMKPKHTIRKRPSRPTLSPASRPSYSRAPTPSFTLAPAESRLSRPRQQGNSDIQLYHLMRSTGDPPIKLFVRLVGERGERVMVRVGGGWADLGEYLKEYSSHHGRRAERSGEIQVELSTNARPRMGSIGSIGSLNPAPGMLRTGHNGNVWSSPRSRPGSSLGSRPGSSLQVRKRGARVSDVADSRENSVRSPSMPLPFTSTTLRANAAKGQTPPARSVSRQAWSVGPDGEEVHLGPSGPKNKKGEMNEGRKRWVEGVVEKVRQVSVESSQDGFGALGQVGGTTRVFRKGQ